MLVAPQVEQEKKQLTQAEQDLLKLIKRGNNKIYYSMRRGNRRNGHKVVAHNIAIKKGEIRQIDYALAQAGLFRLSKDSEGVHVNYSDEAGDTLQSKYGIKISMIWI